MIGVTIKVDRKASQKNDFLMRDGTCVGTNKFDKGKKETYCKRCIHAIILHDGYVCPKGLNENW